MDLDLNFFEDQLENEIMLDKIDTTLAIEQSKVSSMNNLELDIKTADITSADFTQLFQPNIFRGLSQIEEVPLNRYEPFLKINKQEDLTDALLEEQNKESIEKKESYSTLNTVNLNQLEELENLKSEKENVKVADLELTSDQNLCSQVNPNLSSTESDSSTNVIKKKRGRRPNSIANASDRPTRPSKRDLVIEKAADNGNKVVCFGNLVVEKNTDEYIKRRSRNNDAVKKCREKSTIEQKEKEARMKTLDMENKKLTNQVDSLMKELNVLKNFFIQMSPQHKLPEHIEKLIVNLNDP